MISYILHDIRDRYNRPIQALVIHGRCIIFIFILVYTVLGKSINDIAVSCSYLQRLYQLPDRVWVAESVPLTILELMDVLSEVIAEYGLTCVDIQLQISSFA